MQPKCFKNVTDYSFGSLKNASQLKKHRKTNLKKQNLFSQTKNVKQFHSETPKLKINYYRRVN